jgi:hypothetical protein
VAKLENDVHKKISNALADTRCSPAVLARLMLNENKYINESFMQYFINYIVLMATRTHVPIYLIGVQKECKILYTSLTELGLTGTVGREEVNTSEYLQV